MTLLSKVSILSEYSEPVILTAADLKRSGGGQSDPNSSARWLGSRLKPTIIAESPILSNPLIVAPYGRADPEAWKKNQSMLKWKLFGVAALLFGGAFLLGRASKR